MGYDQILKYLLFSKLSGVDKYIRLVSWYLTGFLAQDELVKIVELLNIQKFTQDEMDTIAKLELEVLEPLRIEESLDYPGIMDSGRKRYIHNINILKEATIRNRYRDIWHVKKLPDNTKINDVKDDGNLITFLEEYGFADIPELDIMVSRTVQPVFVSGANAITEPAVFILPSQPEKALEQNLPHMRAFGGGLGLYANFKAVTLSDDFRRQYGCPAETAFVCIGYCDSFENPQIKQRVDGYLLEWLIS